MRVSRTSLPLLSICLALLLTGANVPAQEPESLSVVRANTSSPRGTLQTFLNALDVSLPIELKVTLSYISSDRLYPNDAERRLWAENEKHFLQALETVDLSGLPSGFAEPLATERLV